MITVIELLSYPLFRDFQLSSGHKGLSNEVSGTAIFEWESPEDVDKTFAKGEFVVTTLSQAKGDAACAEKCLRMLILKKVSAIAIKRVYFNEISEEINALSSSHNVPIFFFSEVYFDDIIFAIKNALTFDSMNTYYVEKLKIILSPNMDSKSIENIAKDINPFFYNNIICSFASLNDRSSKNEEDLDYYYRNCLNIGINQVTDVLNSVYSVIKYNHGILIIYTTNNTNSDLKDSFMTFLSKIKFDNKIFVVGLSNTHYGLDNLGKALRESIYSNTSCIIDNIQFQHFDSIGLDKLLMPIRNDPWVKEYYNGFFDKIAVHDAVHNTDFFNTLLEYVKCNGDIQLVAKKSFQHSNTIRYRIDKVKKILNIEGSVESFHQLFIFVRLYQIYNNLEDIS